MNEKFWNLAVMGLYRTVCLCSSMMEMQQVENGV